MFDSLPYRNDAAIVFRRLIRSLPTRARRARRRHLRQGPAGDDDGAGRHARSAVRARARRRDAAADRRRGRGQGADHRRALRARRDHARAGGRRWAAAPAHRRAAAASSSARRRRRRWSARRSGMSLPHTRARAVGPADLARHGAALGARADARWRRAASTMRDILTDAARPQRDGRPRGVRRLDEPAAAPPGDRPRRRAAPADRRRLDARSTARCRGWSTRCPTARAIIRRCRCSWPAACPR